MEIGELSFLQITTNSLPADINWAVQNCLLKYDRLDYSKRPLIMSSETQTLNTFEAE